MNKILGLMLLSMTFAAICVAQTPTPTPSPADSDVVKVTTTLIQVDVTVTDKDGRVVTGLKPEDFEVYENNKLQPISNFSFIDIAGRKTPERTQAANTASSVPATAVTLRREQVRRTIALVVDDLALSAESILFVKKALTKFVEEQMQPNDLVAIIRTGSGAGSLEQFTADKNILRTAINKIRWNPMGRAGVGPLERLEPTLQEQIQANTAIPSRAGAGAGSMLSDQAEAEKDRIAIFNELREDAFTIGTLGTLGFVVRGMSDMPGRKSMMLFSDGFSICTRTDVKKDAPRCTRMEESMRKLTDAANRAAVTIYTQDARGLLPLGLSVQDTPASLPTSLQDAQRARTDESLDKQQGLTFLAAQTGGRAVLNTNNLNLGLEQLLEDGKGFYLLGFQPDSEFFDPKTQRFNKLTVKVLRPGLNVTYRSGFYGVADTAPGDKPAGATAETPAQQVLKAISSPFGASDINLRLNTLFGRDDKNNSFIQSFLHIEARDLTFTDTADGGGKQATFDVLAITIGETGAIVDRVVQNYTITIKKDKFQQLQAEGFVYNFALPVKKPGAYQLRVALRDAGSAKLGSTNQFIEVPDLKGGAVSLSGIVLENFTGAQWKEMTSAPDAGRRQIDLMQDTSLRRFKRGTVLSYTSEIYNAKVDRNGKPQIETQIKMFRDGTPVLVGTSKPYDPAGQSNPSKFQLAGALGLGNEMKPGDYVLQIVVVDKLSKGSRAIASQWVQFELID